MVMLLDEPSAPGEHAIDPDAAGEQGGYVLENGQHDIYVNRDTVALDVAPAPKEHRRDQLIDVVRCHSAHTAEAVFGPFRIVATRQSHGLLELVAHRQRLAGNDWLTAELGRFLGRRGYPGHFREDVRFFLYELDGKPLNQEPVAECISMSCRPTGHAMRRSCG